MLAVIGGSGVHEIDGLANKRWVKVESSFGALSGGPSVGGLGPVQRLHGVVRWISRFLLARFRRLSGK
jgi:hypothetical protein